MNESRPLGLGAELRLGLAVIAVLGALTAVEWIVGTGLQPNLAPLAVIAVVKAGLIVCTSCTCPGSGGVRRCTNGDGHCPVGRRAGYACAS